MSEERLKILEMLDEGKITAEEAAALLKQMPDGDESRYEHCHNWERRSHPPHPHHPPYRPDFGWISDLRDAIEETTRQVLSPTEFIYGARREKFMSSSSIGNGIRILVFDGKNAPMRLETYSGDKIEVEAYYKAKSNWNPHFALTEENGIFGLSYDGNALYMLGLTIRVPNSASIGSVRLKNKNANISVNSIRAEKIELCTKNDSIRVSDTKGEYLYCETKNAVIALDDVEMKEIDAQTSNSRISLDDVEAFHARLVTSNAKIDIRDSDIVELYAKTTNSPLRFDNLGCKGQEVAYSVDAITTNGQISVNIPRGEFKSMLRASTTNGGIFNEINDLEYQINEKNYVEAQSYGYEAAQKKLNMNLQTTNARIYIKR